MRKEEMMLTMFLEERNAAIEEQREKIWDQIEKAYQFNPKRDIGRGSLEFEVYVDVEVTSLFSEIYHELKEAGFEISKEPINGWLVLRKVIPLYKREDAK